MNVFLLFQLFVYQKEKLSRLISCELPDLACNYTLQLVFTCMFHSYFPGRNTIWSSIFNHQPTIEVTPNEDNS